ncbi:hypothetical protein B0H15DRAFT_847010 [Mycena belliarum]|uniref:Uncharacterized protein n=1 Tax=Mycena belliarum TaxID=1033014 RepID=A0AAD6XQH8_9AGAR|nr:hypothetical protein B0H15DRAFT_847010 [Mycena belliae]
MALLPAYLKISALLSRLLGVQGSGGLRRDSNPRVGRPLFPPLIPKMVGGLSFCPISTRLSFHRTCLVQCTGSNPGQYYFNQESRKDSTRVLRRWSPAYLTCLCPVLRCKISITPSFLYRTAGGAVAAVVAAVVAARTVAGVGVAGGAGVGATAGVGAEAGAEAAPARPNDQQS